MYILKNAFKNLRRNKGRNALIGIIMTGILSCVAISIIITTAANKMIENYKENFGSEVFIQANQEKQNEKIANGTYNPKDFNIPSSVYEKLAKSEYVKDAIMSANFRGYSEKIRAIDQQENSNTNVGGGVLAIGPNGNTISEGYKIPNLNIQGGFTPEGAKEFESGTRKIVEGKLPESNGQAIISEEFAKLNKLKVGDKLEIKNPSDTKNSKALDLTITGIYYDGSKENNLGFKHPMVNRKNEIITTYNTLREYSKNISNDAVSIEAKYYLKNPDLVEKFNEEAHREGLSDMYDISIDSASYNNIIKPAEGLKKIAWIFMILVLGAGGSVLVLISILGIRERKYEIGVLRAMGMKKNKVALGLIFETIIMIGISLAIGLSISSVSAQPVSNILLKNQIEGKSDIASSMSATIGMQAQTQVPKLENLSVQLDERAMVGIILIAILLGVISVVIGIVYINRYEPRKILAERN